MQLYLHIGTEKTGSSYLQSLAANNRNVLLESGIHFPKGKLESQMLRGEISDGNAQVLTNLLIKDDWNEVEHYLKKYFNEGKRRNAEKVLLSNELMVLSLNTEEKICKFFELIYKAGFVKIAALLIIREPISQVISLYKHRAKGGRIPKFERWVKESYYYGKGIRNFLEAQEKINWKFTCRKYNSKEGVIKDIFFRDWLNLDIGIEEQFKKVNPSLSLSELEVIRMVQKHNAVIASNLYQQLIGLPEFEKAKDQARNKYLEDIAAEYLQQFEMTWELCNSYLPKNEKLQIKNPSDTCEKDELHQVAFSEKQMSAIINFLINQRNLSQQLHTGYLGIRKTIGSIKNKITSKKE